MDIALIIIGSLLMVIGLVGCIVPGLPGVPLSYVGLWCLFFTTDKPFDWKFMLIWGAVTVVVTIIDTVAPVWFTKKTGGSKRATWGSIVGLIVALFCGPWWMLILPFVGAVAFELMGGAETLAALKSGTGAFLGLLFGTVLKLVCSGMMTWYFIRAIAF